MGEKGKYGELSGRNSEKRKPSKVEKKMKRKLLSLLKYMSE